MTDQNTNNSQISDIDEVEPEIDKLTAELKSIKADINQITSETKEEMKNVDLRVDDLAHAVDTDCVNLDSFLIEAESDLDNLVSDQANEAVEI